jgi:hypothetical protein
MDSRGLSTSTRSPVNLVLHCATRSQRIVLNAPEALAHVRQCFQRETRTHAM